MREMVARYWSNDILRELGPNFKGRIINVSAWRDEDREGNRYRDYFPNAASYEISNHPGDKKRGSNESTDLEIDITAPLPRELEKNWEVCFHHTVLEHVPDPFIAFENICKMSADAVISVVPFRQKFHFEPGNYLDFWRFTPAAMRRLYELNGLEVVYESFSPNKSKDVYLFYVGSRHPGQWDDIAMRLPDLESLNMLVGEQRGWDILQNIIFRFRKKYLGGI